MIYSIVSILRSLLFAGFLAIIGFIVHIEVLDLKYIDNFTIFYNLFTVLSVCTIMFYIKSWKYLNLPYSINLHSSFLHNGLFKLRNTRSLFLDFYWKKDDIKSRGIVEKVLCKDLKRFSIIYKNLISMNIDNYRKNQEKILHFFGLIQDGFDMKVEPIGEKDVKLSFYCLPKIYKLDISAMKYGFIFNGIDYKGLNQTPITELSHILCIGQSGSGKSNYLHNFILNLLFNKDSFKSLHLVDMKGGVELEKYKGLNKIESIYEPEDFNHLLTDFVEDMNLKYKEMKESSIRKSYEKRFIIVDELASLSACEKSLKEDIHFKLGLIAQKGRASGHFLYLSAQVISQDILKTNVSVNIATKVLFRTDSDYNINLLSHKDFLRERVTSTEVADFVSGKCILKDAKTSNLSLVQVPFVSDNFINSMINYYKGLS